MKHCPRCNKEALLKDFHKSKYAKDGLDGWCKYCRIKLHQEYYWKRRNANLCAIAGCKKPKRSQYAECEYHAQKSREYGHVKKYGISLKERNEKIDYQKGLCDLCGLPLLESVNTCLDHNHDTGKVRGVIHRQCNIIIGSAGDNLKMLEMAVQYLKRYEAI